LASPDNVHMPVLPVFELPAVSTNNQSGVRRSKDKGLRSIFRINMSNWKLPTHMGPQTTNLAEGYHKSRPMNCRFGMPHPSMSSLLDWLQKLQSEVQCRLTQLAAGRPPKQRDSVYVKLDKEIRNVKVVSLVYSQNVSYVFAYRFPHAHAWNMFFMHTEGI